MKIFIVVLNTAYEGDSLQEVFKHYKDAEACRIERNKELLTTYGSLDVFENYVIEEVVRGS